MTFLDGLRGLDAKATPAPHRVHSRKDGSTHVGNPKIEVTISDDAEPTVVPGPEDMALYTLLRNCALDIAALVEAVGHYRSSLALNGWAEAGEIHSGPMLAALSRLDAKAKEPA